MEKFKLVQEESFESIARYLNLIYQLTELENPLAFVDVDDKRFMITKIVNYDEPVDNGYVVVYDEDGRIRTAGLFYDSESFIANMGDVSYKVREELVLREYMINGFKEQLSCTDTIEANPKKTFNYHQVDPLNRRIIDMHYFIDGYGNPNIALPYLKNKNPKAIELTTQKHIIPTTRQYTLDNNTYYRYKRINDETIMLLELLKKYSAEEMMELIQSYGCNTRIPNDMIELYFGENKDVKTLRKVADTYRKNTQL